MTTLEQIGGRIPAAGALLIAKPQNIRYLCGFTGSNGQVFMTRKKTCLLTDARYMVEARKIVPKGVRVIDAKKKLSVYLKKLCARNRVTTVYFEGDFMSYASAVSLRKTLSPVRFQPAGIRTEEFRHVKSRDEAAKLVKAQRIAEKIFLSVRRNLRTGITEKEIAFRIAELAAKLGGDGVSFPPIVAFGSNSGCPHHKTGARKLKKGDIVLIDMGVTYGGYCSDMTRMIFTAPPTARQKKIYNLVLSAQEKAITNIKAGITGKEADKLARGLIKKAGYGKYFTHSLGHGVGLEIHEEPSLSINSCNPVQDGAVVTVEPGIYLSKSFGVRLEDMILVKGKKARIITKTPKDIRSCVINLK